jgi:putative PEP-CTERM system histidine kinase
MFAGIVGYGLAAAGFAGLALLVIASWRGRLEGGLLLGAVVITALWAGLTAWDISSPDAWRAAPAMEILRDAAWLVFLARITPAGQGRMGLSRQLVSFVPGLFVLFYGLSGSIGVGTLLTPSDVIRTLVYSGLVSAISVFVFLEQVYRGLNTEHRRAVLPLVVGVGGVFAYDLFLYSHGLLFRTLHLDLWAARGFVNLLAVPLLVLAARRNPSWSVDVFISRHVTFYGTSLLGIGLYFLLMAVAGYWLKVLGREWGPVLQAVFFFGAGGLLAYILFSPALRARIKVFIAKHFYANKYDYRDEWLRLTGALSAPDADPDLARRCLRAMAALVEAEGGVLWEERSPREGGGFERTAVAGPVENAPAVIAADDPVVDFMKRRKWTIDVAEASREPQSHPGLDLPDWVEPMGLSTLVVPLLAGEELWGVAALVRPRGIGKLNYEDIDLLKVASMQVAAVLAQGEADRLLAESRQFEAYNRFAAFIMHDLKNVIAQQSLVVRNAAKYRDDPAFIDDALDTVANSVERMQRLLEQLKRGQGEARVERVGVEKLLREIVNRHTDREPVPTARSGDPGLHLRIDRERLEAVLGHLVANAQDATPADGRVTIEAALEDDRVVLAVEDDGTGMDEAFMRERLFRPFDSTKGSKGMGIGAYQARQFAESLGGEVHVRTAPGEGTRFELRLPAALLEGKTSG